METEKTKKRFAILGGGPSALFTYKRLVEAGDKNIEIEIFERKAQLGAGMPYSTEGANEEHITNVSDNEIPTIVNSIEDWVSSAPSDTLKQYNITEENFNEYKVLPRLFFGQYLTAQFDLLQKKAKEAGIETTVHLNCTVMDIIDDASKEKVSVVTDGATKSFDTVIICTGHNWPQRHEGKIPGYFDSPYPPSKLALKANYPVAIRGSSLTAIDAIRTLARHNGSFQKNEDGILSFQHAAGSEEFKMVMHSRNGFLPAVRFHLEDSHLSKDSVLPVEEVHQVRAENDGFIPLDFLFQKHFKEPLREGQPEFYERIKDMSIEDFVEAMLNLREQLDPFVLLKAEYAEAEKSIKRQQSVYWKEMLAVLSFAMNYPAKYLSAEDMLRLQKVLMPLISVVIAFVPQSSCKELLALYDAGAVSLVSVGDDSTVMPQKEGGAIYNYTDDNGLAQSVHYKIFVDCIGQPHLPYSDFPFQSLRTNGSITPARLKFKSAEEGSRMMQQDKKKVEQDAAGDYYLKVPGIAINDAFQVLDKYGAYNKRLYIMAVPYIGGFNPDYSGLDFGETASARIINSMIENGLINK